MFMELPVRRLFVKCVTPAVITAVFGALYSVVDGFLVGKFLGSDALAAVNLIMPIIMIVSVFGILIFHIGFLFILTPIWGLNGVWLMLPVSGVASALLAIILYRRQSIAD